MQQLLHFVEQDVDEVLGVVEQADHLAVEGRRSWSERVLPPAFVRMRLVDVGDASGWLGWRHWRISLKCRFATDSSKAPAQPTAGSALQYRSTRRFVRGQLRRMKGSTW